MHDTVSPLMREFLEWVARQPRTYAETMTAWRSNCPRHTVWEDASIDGLIQVEGARHSDECPVVLTARGRALLAEAPQMDRAAD